MRTIELSSEKKIVIEVREEISVNLSSINLEKTEDNGQSVVATIITEKGGKKIVLWDSESSPSYTEIGQYTDNDINNRLDQLL